MIKWRLLYIVLEYRKLYNFRYSALGFGEFCEIPQGVTVTQQATGLLRNARGVKPLWKISALALILLLFYSTGSLEAKEKIKIAVLTGTHKYNKKKFSNIFKSFNNIEFEILKKSMKEGKHIYDDIKDWPYDVLVFYNYRNILTGKQKKNFLKLTDKGVGLVILHHALMCYPDWPEFDKVAGARFYHKKHPREGDTHSLSKAGWKDPYMKIHVEDPDHPITKGLSDFTVHDENYLNWGYFEGNHLLLSADSKENTKEIAYTRKYKNSKVCYIMLGHGPHKSGPGCYEDKNFLLLLSNAIRWAVR